MAENDALKPNWNRDYCISRFYEGDNRQALKVGDTLKVVEVSSDVLDMHFGKCESYRLTPVVDLAAPEMPLHSWATPQWSKR